MGDERTRLGVDLTEEEMSRLLGEQAHQAQRSQEASPPGSAVRPGSENHRSGIMKWYEEMANRSRPFATRERMRPASAERVPINVHPLTRKRLTHFLVFGPGKETGIGFSEFIEQSLRLWEELEPVPDLSRSPAEVRHERLLKEPMRGLTTRQ